MTERPKVFISELEKQQHDEIVRLNAELAKQVDALHVTCGALLCIGQTDEHWHDYALGVVNAMQEQFHPKDLSAA